MSKKRTLTPTQLDKLIPGYGDHQRWLAANREALPSHEFAGKGNPGPLRLRDDLDGQNFSGAFLGELDAAGCEFGYEEGLVHIDLTGANLRGTRWRSGLGLVCFQDADLSGAEFTSQVINACNFEHARLNGADLSFATFTGCRFEGADLRGALTTGAKFSLCVFLDTLTDADFDPEAS